ncbi:replication protein A 70 kDa DNA-binding subunit E-like [Macadamia integrifolia]|uniref:replication protein A 70 kDa DNA-binding subunit E-like n=1 Tax=Macadamia integrifolia TaxID=60698 RepID=UPI001C4F0FBE|nr:replication protein A 70 kDa DNA-binding subunit E-like [Macadamia integrifolia]
MAINLTGGAIAMLCNGEAQETDLKPVLQVTDIRLVNTQQQSTNERYRILLSDGSHLQQGMLATQMNFLVKSGKLQKGSIVRLTQFVCNVIQGRMIIIIIDLEVLLENCNPIGEPKQYAQGGATGGPPVPVARPAVSVQPPVNQSGVPAGNAQLYGGGSLASDQLGGQNVAGGAPPHVPKADPVPSYGSSYSGNPISGRYSALQGTRMYPKTEVGSGHPESAPSPGSYNEQNQSFRNAQVEGSRVTMNTYSRPMHPSNQHPPPMYTNRGPIAKNEAPTRIIPIAALNPYQGRWTIKARVTAKGDLRHYNNPRGDGKVFSFDLLDSDGGEIRVTCFNAVADQFYNQIDAGKVYLISKGSLRPAQKNFNHLNNDHEILLESTSTVQPCFEDDNSIPKQQFHFRPISDVEGLQSNAIVDVIGVVSSINPSTSIMRKNGTETSRRSLHLKDMSGRSVELTLWGNFCNAEGQRLQDMRDSGEFPVLAVKAGRINDFNGKAVGTIGTSQLFIDPDFAEARRLKDWFYNEGKNTPSISISRETSGVGRTDVRKTVSQIKDEKLGTSEKPDWITVSVTVTFIKVDNFCYTACPIMIGDRQCSKKVINNGDGKWRCDRCDQCVDECDYRYILQMQIQDHSGLTWVTAFQESGEEIMGVSAKELYYLKHEQQDDEKVAEIIRKVLFTRFIFKLKVKEETFSEEQRVKSTVVKAERVNFSSESSFLLASIEKLQGGDISAFVQRAATNLPDSAMGHAGYGGMGVGSAAPPAVNYLGSSNNVGRDMGLLANQVGQYGNQYSSVRGTAGSTGVYLHCNSCGGTGHTAQNCPSVSIQGQPMGGGFVNRASSGGASNGGTSGECYKCHQVGHWARDCPGTIGINSAYGSSSIAGRYGGVPKQQVGGF